MLYPLAEMQRASWLPLRAALFATKTISDSLAPPLAELPFVRA